MKHKILSLVLILSFLFLAACASSQPATHFETIKENGKMVVGTSGDFPPFESVDANGKLVGYDIDLINEIGKRMGLQVEIKDMPFDSLLAAVQEGKIDLVIAGMNYTEERDQKVDFTDPYFESETVLIVREDFNEPLETSEDVAKYILGTQIGTTADTWITESLIKPGKMPESNLLRYERPEQGALDLKAGRIDAYAIDDIPAYALAKETGGLKVVRLNEASLEAKPMNIVVPEGDQELAQAINAALAELKNEGFLDKLKALYIEGLEQ